MLKMQLDTEETEGKRVRELLRKSENSLLKSENSLCRQADVCSCSPAVSFHSVVADYTLGDTDRCDEMCVDRGGDCECP